MAPGTKRWLIGGLVVAVVGLAVALAVVLTADDGTPDTATRTGTSATSSTTTSPARSSTSSTTAPAVRYVCPEGDLAALQDLQRQVDQGHEPWRASAEDVASQCATGSVGATVEAAGANTYRVTDPATGGVFLVAVTQPVTQGPGGIWAVTSITPAG